jgi:hypothetical protein
VLTEGDDHSVPARWPPATSRIVLAALITIATALFVLGVSVERAEGDRHAGERSEQVRGATDPHAGETEGEGEQRAGAGHESGGRSEAEPRILGVDVEGTPLAVLAATTSLLLAVGVLRWPRAPGVLAVTALAMFAFAALDIREVVHQLDEDRPGIALLAAVIAVLHLSAAGLAAATAGDPARRSAVVRAHGPR